MVIIFENNTGGICECGHFESEHSYANQCLDWISEKNICLCDKYKDNKMRT